MVENLEVMPRVQAHIQNVQAEEVIEAVSNMCQVIRAVLTTFGKRWYVCDRVDMYVLANF